MKQKGMELNVVLYNTLLSLCADMGLTDEAVEIFQDMKCSENCRPDSRAYSSMITMLSCSSKVSDAEGALSDMLQAGFEPNIIVFTSLIQCFGKASRTDDVVKTFGYFGYLAPEYKMYGKVDEKTDVYSYGVVLLELITGKEAIQTRAMSRQESLVLWTRSLLISGLWERRIDPGLNNEYDKDEMKTMMIAARFCLLHSSKRPSIKMILRFLEEPGSWMNTMHMKRDEFLETISAGSESEVWRHNGSDFCDTILADDG